MVLTSCLLVGLAHGLSGSPLDTFSSEQTPLKLEGLRQPQGAPSPAPRARGIRGSQVGAGGSGGFGDARDAGKNTAIVKHHLLFPPLQIFLVLSEQMLLCMTWVDGVSSVFPFGVLLSLPARFSPEPMLGFAPSVSSW